jgi:hypothetical protein
MIMKNYRSSGTENIAQLEYMLLAYRIFSDILPRFRGIETGGNSDDL